MYVIVYVQEVISNLQIKLVKNSWTYITYKLVVFVKQFEIVVQFAANIFRPQSLFRIFLKKISL